MAGGYEIASFVVDVITAFKGNDLAWKKQACDDLLELKRKKQLGEQEIAHAIDLIKARHKGELEMEQERQKRRLKDYKDFLDSLDEMKRELIDNFSDMPKPMVLLIYNHGKQILDNMYKKENKNAHEGRFANFMITYFNDCQNAKQRGTENRLPLPEGIMGLIGNQPT
ncbi:hypothetical protein ThidrDRAFT_3769 [Thiorhodococcus drewsii AZ1]|uniref:Uncharacterized protein n=1 Tax=Thiorhodococcus drewsii AZ1 TaxID=765913 RepID=G2E656_9GAMM|nr:hypothetical protein [Thiorhodococcus drewsii]EGV28404.1 hypothetical protein ThidrDRAFT_3769 [Thiorhodococcus drewsii AZ1]